MARDFDGVDDQIVGSITAFDTGDITMAMWVNIDSSGEGNAGDSSYFFSTVSGGSVGQALYLDSSRRFQIFGQNFPTQAAWSAANEAIATTTWTCIIGTFRVSDAKSRGYIGTLSASMAEVTYSTQPVGTGSRPTGYGSFAIGNYGAFGSRTVDGRIARVVFENREWSLAEMEAYRLGWRPAPIAGGVKCYLWSLDSPTASQAEELNHGADGTVTGALAAEGPPIPYGWSERESGLMTPVLVSGGSRRTVVGVG